MNRSHSDLPIVIKKRKHGAHGHHGGAWKVAYADFVTAMMALFIVLWIVGQSKQVKEYVAHYFRDPGAFFENSTGGGAFNGTTVPMPQQHVEDNLRRETKRMEHMASTLTNKLGQDSSLHQLLSQISFEMTEEGMRINLNESAQGTYFDLGTSRLKPEAIGILTTIATEIGRLPNDVVIEGHTDALPYSSTLGYTNFELSTDRANAARRLLMANGLRAEQLSDVRGYADTRLRDRNRPFDASNRRISIVIKFGEQ